MEAALSLLPSRKGREGRDIQVLYYLESATGNKETAMHNREVILCH